MNKKIIFALILVIMLLCGITALVTIGAESDVDEKPKGFSFKMTLSTQGEEDAVFMGIVLGDDMRLESKIHGIETVILSSSGKLYALTPAIKIAQELDYLSPPKINEEGWSKWLAEQGRVNPLTFARLVGFQQQDGKIKFGAADSVEAVFKEGKLTKLIFSSPDRKKIITYTYSEYREDKNIGPEKFKIPEDYKILT